MPISLEEERKPGLPVVKRTALGQTFVGAVLRVEQRDRLKRDEVTGMMTPVLKAGGKARQELVVTCLTLPGTDAPAGIGDDEHVPQTGDVVRLILRGRAFGDWIESRAALGRPVQVGDLVTQRTDRAQVYDAQGNASGPEITEQAALNAVPRGRSVGIYGPLTLAAQPDPAVVAQAEAAYHALTKPILAEPEDTWTATGNGAMTATADPPKPAAISQAAWDAMDASTRQAVANTMSTMASDEPPF